MLKRVVILGNGGSGKSTYARALAKSLNLPVIHLDRYYWHDNWQAIPPAEWQAIHAKLIAQPKWIIEGAQFRQLKSRIERAEKVIFLDVSPLVCAWRIIKKHCFSQRQNDGYRYSWRWRNFWWVLRFNRRYRQKILTELQHADCPVEIISH